MWEWIEQVAIIIATLAAGGPGVVWAVGKLKAQLGLSGQRVWWLAAGVSLIAALASAVVDGVVSPETLAVENVAQITLGVFFASQAYYRMIRDQDDDEKTVNQFSRPMGGKGA